MITLSCCVSQRLILFDYIQKPTVVNSIWLMMDHYLRMPMHRWEKQLFHVCAEFNHDFAFISIARRRWQIPIDETIACKWGFNSNATPTWMCCESSTAVAVASDSVASCWRQKFFFQIEADSLNIVHALHTVSPLFLSKNYRRNSN